MITKLISSAELERIFIEALINKTEGAVNKVSPNSVLSGIAAGVSKIAQKTLKEVSLVESVNFPDSASGLALDVIAEKNGISPRFGASSSSTYIRISATAGTVYSAAVNRFVTNSGIIFQLDSDVTVPPNGYIYSLVRSTTQGKRTNVNPGEIRQMDVEPTGHLNVVNEYKSVGGRDVEEDFLFRKRIKEGPNILATGTLAMLEQAFNKINNEVLRIFYYGLDSSGKAQIAVASISGGDFTQVELDALLEQGEKFFSLTELRPFNHPQAYGMKLINVVYQPIDISFRVELLQNFNPDQIRIDIQTRLSKLVDYRNWKTGKKVEWDDLLEIVKNTRGVKYVPDQFFNPREDIKIDAGKLPRFRNFLMLDLTGAIIVDSQQGLNPIYYPFPADIDIQTTALRTI